MATIYTDTFVSTDCDIEIGEPSMGYEGRELILSAGDEQEIRVRLTDEQFRRLADALRLNGYMWFQAVFEETSTELPE